MVDISESTGGAEGAWVLVAVYSRANIAQPCKGVLPREKTRVVLCATVLWVVPGWLTTKVMAGDTRGFRDPPTGREHPTWSHKAQAARRAELWSDTRKNTILREFWKKKYEYLRIFTNQNSKEIRTYGDPWLVG